MNWRDRAACAGMFDVDWFPHPSARTPVALQVCRECPVRQECLEDALGEGLDQFGVRGGHTEKQRMRMARSRTRAAVAECGTDAGYYRHLRQLMTVPCDLCRRAHADAWLRRKWRRRLGHEGRTYV